MQLACYTEKEEGNSKCLWETVSGPANPIQMAPYLIPSIYCHRRQPAASTTTVKPAFSISCEPNKHYSGLILTLFYLEAHGGDIPNKNTLFKADFLKSEIQYLVFFQTASQI